MKNAQLMDYMVSLHFIDFISWGVLANGPLYCITLCIVGGGAIVLISLGPIYSHIKIL
jgi:hypothetical protein